MRLAEALRLASMSVAAAAAGAPSYRVVDLGSLGGPSRALALAPNGWTAGMATDPGNLHRGFVRAPGGVLTSVGVLAPDTLSWAFAATSNGEAYGVSFALGEPFPRAFRWVGSGIALLGSFSARGANDAGVVVGHATVQTPTGLVDHACVHSGAALAELPGLGGTNWYARAVNQGGRVAGMSWLAGDGAHHACVWQGGVAHDLGTLGGATSQALALNDLNQAAGFSALASGDPHACVFTLDGGGSIQSRTDLGTLPGSRSSAARGINNRGQVVGVSDGRPFYWRPGAAMADLNDRIRPTDGWSLTEMFATNDAGRITGYGVFNGMPRAVMLEPCEGDADGDFLVAFPDLNIVLSNYGLDVPAGEAGDFDNDGRVTFNDLNLLLSRFGQPC